MAHPNSGIWTIRRGLFERLAVELDDAALAGELTNALSDDLLARYAQRIDVTAFATAPILAMQAPTAPIAEIDSVIVFAFGNRRVPNGSLLPGPVNEALAEVTAELAGRHSVPIFAQWEVAELLMERNVAAVVSIEPEVEADGTITYLSTAGVASKAASMAAATGQPLGHVGVIAFSDHAVRCVLTVRRAGFDAAVPQGVALPDTYDSESAQDWTRNRLSYLQADLWGRLALLD